MMSDPVTTQPEREFVRERTKVINGETYLVKYYRMKYTSSTPLAHPRVYELAEASKLQEQDPEQTINPFTHPRS